jgi:hypothetical protein
MSSPKNSVDAKGSTWRTAPIAKGSTPEGLDAFATRRRPKAFAGAFVHVKRNPVAGMWGGPFARRVSVPWQPGVPAP